jgi:N-glycosylase/DNA lyase
MIFEEYERKKEVIKKRLDEFSKVSEENYFYELCFCLLTPGSKARQAEKVVDFLKKENFENKSIEFGDELKKVRFHNNKRKNLVEMKGKYLKILKKLREEKDNLRLREYLVENVRGLGYKEASHFLRNIGKKNLVILDRHILKNMVKFEALDKIPDTISKKNYLNIEQNFKKLAKNNNISTDDLDLLFWSFETGEVFK